MRVAVDVEEVALETGEGYVAGCGGDRAAAWDGHDARLVSGGVLVDVSIFESGELSKFWHRCITWKKGGHLCNGNKEGRVFADS